LVSGQGTESEPAPLVSIGSFKVTVNPTAAEPILFEPIEADPSRLGTQSTLPLDPSLSVLSSATLTGPGTWDPVTQTMTAPILVTHTGVINASFNEPQMVVRTLSDTTGTVTFETSNNPGVKGVGATMAFSDIERPVGSTRACGTTAAHTTAKHKLVIKDTIPATSFSFNVDVRARLVGVNVPVNPDCDNDNFNAEVNQDAGGDCNDNDATLTGSQCNCIDQCTTPGGTCTQAVTSGAFTCPLGDCSCNVAGTGGTDVNVTCQNDCSVQCDGATDGTDLGNLACRTTCQNGNDCALNCSHLVGDDCGMACTGGSTCNLNCNDSTGACEYQSCIDGSTCNAACVGNGTICGVSSCGNGGDCAVTCGTSTAQANFSTRCGINACGRDATCLVTCVNPGPQGCTLKCSSTSSDCTMDCSAIPDVPAGNRAAMCKLTCPTGRTKIDVGGGVYECL
jgi:hypothetical protein